MTFSVILYVRPNYLNRGKVFSLSTYLIFHSAIQKNETLFVPAILFTIAFENIT